MFAPENGWLEDEFSFWDGSFSRAFGVSFTNLLGRCLINYIYIYIPPTQLTFFWGVDLQFHGFNLPSVGHLSSRYTYIYAKCLQILLILHQPYFTSHHRSILHFASSPSTVNLVSCFFCWQCLILLTFYPWWITTKSPFGKYPLSQWLTFKLFVDYILFSREIKGEQPLFCGPKSLEWESTFVSSPYHPCKVKIYFPTHFKNMPCSCIGIYLYIYTIQLGEGYLDSGGWNAYLTSHEHIGSCHFSRSVKMGSDIDIGQ